MITRVTAKDMKRNSKHFGFFLTIPESRLFIYFCKERKVKPNAFVKTLLKKELKAFCKKETEKGNICDGHINMNLFD